MRDYAVAIVRERYADFGPTRTQARQRTDFMNDPDVIARREKALARMAAEQTSASECLSNPTAGPSLYQAGP
ncbi:hypothetical protein [Rhizobium mesoamericanum]|uniref:hypothetical protein n=1 Tax=Rhizobium mesoamericanum TaxID=1079800 RepID=UPI0012FB21CD|nr:hypothetical protein [Rhizobium mesoamericanum]